MIVRFGPGLDGGERAEVRERADVDAQAPLPLPGAEVVDPEPGTTTREAIESLQREDDVLYAEPDVPRYATATPNDPLLGQLWGLVNRGQAVAGRSGPSGVDIDAREAWAVETGDDALRVAVLDTGVDATHPGLQLNMWRNPGESGGGAREQRARRRRERAGRRRSRLGPSCRTTAIPPTPTVTAPT